MAVILRVYIIDPGDYTIKVGHEFYGETEREADTYMHEHLGSCDYFSAAHKEGRIIEEVEQVDRDELPSPQDWEDYEEEE